jgi:hypothetical protein
MAGRLLIADRGMLRELINETRQACDEALDGSDLHDAVVALRRAGVIESSVRLLVHAVTPSMRSQEPVRFLLAELAAAGHIDSDAVVERCLLIQTARASLATLPALPVSESVKAMVCDEVQSWTRLGQHEKAGFRVGTSRFVDMSLIASLRRFPAGQFDWVRGGLPLSYLLSVTPRELPRALYTAAVRLRGRAPVFFTHFGYRRFEQSLSEMEANRSYYRMARSMELQPDVKGLVASSWFRSPDTHRVSPHLAWVNTVVVENGGFAAVRGPADPNCGVFVRSQTRRHLYERGEFTPTIGLVLWPRRAMLAWAAAHPELE